MITLSSARGVGRTGISLRKEDLGMLKIDDFSVVKTRYNPIDSTIEDWRERLTSDFVQLVGRIVCVGSGKEDAMNLKRCIIIARPSKKNQTKKYDDGILTWYDCYKLIQTIPSFEINKEIVFCDFNSKVSMLEEDRTLDEQCPHLKSSIKEVSKESLHNEILSHINLGTQIILKNSSVGTINFYAKKVKTLTKEFLDFLKTEYSFKDDQIVVNWGDNSSYLFSGKNQKAIIQEI